MRSHRRSSIASIRSCGWRVDAWRLLESHHWPGNIRELQNVVEQLSSVGHDRELTAEDMPIYAATTVPVHLQPRSGDRRRTHMDTLFDQITNGTAEFWRDVYEVFMDREMTRSDVRHLIARGLAVADGSYRELLEVLRLPREDYKRLLNFLVRARLRRRLPPVPSGIQRQARDAPDDAIGSVK